MMLPQTWDSRSIESVYDFTKKPREIVYSEYDRVPFIPMEMVPIDKPYINNHNIKSGRDIRSGNYFEKGDVLLAKITPSFENGKQGIAKDIPNSFGVASTELIPIRGKKGISSKYFLFYYLLEKEVRKQITQKMEGSTGRQRIPISVLKKWLLPFPPLKEQEKIAAVLFKIQQAIEVQESIIEAAQDLKKSTMQHVFTYGLRGERTKETEIGRMPESWGIESIENCCEIKSSTISFKELKKIKSQDNSIFYHAIKVSDMNLYGNEKWIYKANFQFTYPRENINKKAIPPNTIIFPKRGAAISTNKKRLTTQWTFLDPNIIAVIPLSHINNEFLYYWFLTFDLTGIQDLGPTPQLNKKDVAPLIFPCPAYSEQEEIVSTLSTIDKKIKHHTSKKITLQDLFKTMLNKLMTGEIRVKDLDIYIADVKY